MQRVEQECGLDPPTGIELDPDRAAIEANDRLTLEEKILEACDRFRHMPEEIRPTPTQLDAYATFCLSFRQVFSNRLL